MSVRYSDAVGPRGRPERVGPVQAVRDRMIVALQRVGFVVGAMYVLTLPSRKSGILRSTPVSILTIGDERFVAAPHDDLDWVQDARACGRGTLQRGRVDERVVLTEIPAHERAAILRRIPAMLPAQAPQFQRVHGIDTEPESFARLAARCPVFRVERG
jgi:hypothetical protein